MTTSPPPADRFRTRFSVTPAAVLIVCALALSLLGLTILFSASAAFRQGAYFYLNKQLAGVVVAAGLCFVVSRLDLDYVRRYAWWIAGAVVVLLLLVLLTHPINGSRRWLGFGAARVQVSEFAKLGVVFCLAHYLALNQSRIGDFKHGFIWPLVIIGVPAMLIQREPDFGSAALIGVVGLTLLFLAGARLRYLIPAGALAVVGFVALVINDPIRLKRVLAFLDPEGTKQGVGYQNWQALLAFASGGPDGVGLGQGRQQLNFLPEAHTDMILAIVGEELGLWFTLGIVIVFTVMLIAGLIHLRRAPNLFQFLLVAGCLLLMCVQAIINLGVVTALLPNKGMPLPFISAGLSNLLLMGILIGIFLNTQRTWSRASLPERARAMREVLA
ncbi:MAG: cell division protein FtsW [Opitutus sp.]|nr:cell division protein FtsW [Opitutus sp.]